MKRACQPPQAAQTHRRILADGLPHEPPAARRVCADCVPAAPCPLLSGGLGKARTAVIISRRRPTGQLPSAPSPASGSTRLCVVGLRPAARQHGTPPHPGVCGQLSSPAWSPAANPSAHQESAAHWANRIATCNSGEKRHMGKIPTFRLLRPVNQQCHRRIPCPDGTANANLISIQRPFNQRSPVPAHPTPQPNSAPTPAHDGVCRIWCRTLRGLETSQVCAIHSHQLPAGPVQICHSSRPTTVSEGIRADDGILHRVFDHRPVRLAARSRWGAKYRRRSGRPTPPGDDRMASAVLSVLLGDLI